MVNPVLLDKYIWEWDRIPYTMLRRALNILKASAGEDRIDKWILSNEEWLRNVDSPHWKHGLVTLTNADIVFPNSTLFDTHRIIRRPDSLPGFEVLCDLREPQITIQPSTDAFKKVFNIMTGGLLNNLDWANIFVAGGMALGTLVSVQTPDLHPDVDVREPYKSSDIDIYIYGLSAADATAKIRSVYNTFRFNVAGTGTQTLMVKNSKTITFYATWPTRRIQIVLKLVESPKHVLLNFDLDICAIGWDGSDVWMLPRTARALETGSNVFTMNLIHGHYLSERRASQRQRIFKYANKANHNIRFHHTALTLPSIGIWPSNTTLLRRETPRDGDSSTLGLDIKKRAKDIRRWTEERYEIFKLFRVNGRLRYSDLDDAQPSRGFLTGFTMFMRHVSYWEIALRDKLNVKNKTWAYEDTYEDNPDDSRRRGSRWDETFHLDTFIDSINRSNRKEIQNWLQTDTTQRLERHGVTHGDELEDAQRTTSASRLDHLLDSAHDIKIPLLLPCDFATYANEVVNQMLRRPILEVAVPDVHPEPSDQGLFIWRIAHDLMWQQEDRKIDELFEVLLAFRRVNSPIEDDEDQQTQKLIEELSRRDVRASGADEFKSFRRWIAQDA
ncbi:hypothetical protein B0H11DRAFT_1946103 [Mycena galericulata]|nr:hypothetical protein B0H11DRAFT_1946103 [Mycena galericulata]